jgi:eukaryotic-like serine/threonine-protein kinase
LKPGNVMLTRGGAKLMDFGLAKLHSFAGGAQSATPAFSAVAKLASMTSPVTVAGTVVGTVQYMSPEQIQGKDADGRSDIFAFGAMTYEMLTGKRAFEGKSQLSVASAVLEKEPEPISAIQPLTPPALEHLVRTCLAKEPDQRFQSAHDLKLQLQWIVAGGSQAGAPVVVISQRKHRQRILAGVLIAGWLVAVAAVVLAAMYANRLTSAQQLVRATIEQPADHEFTFVFAGAPVLSPDGRTMAFVASKDNETSIFLQPLSRGKAERLAGTDGGIFPFWSPDGKYIGFFAEGKLKKIAVGGGPAQTVCDAPDGRGGSWNEQGTIIFAPRIAGPLERVSDGGGTPQGVTPEHKDDAQFTNRNPYFLPDGKHFLFVQRGGKETVGSVWAGSLNGGEPKPILPAGSNVAYANGYLFYLKDSALMAQAFDPAGLRLQGKPVSLAESVEYYNPRDVGYFSVSRNVLLYRQAIPENRELIWMDTSGKEVDHWGEPAPYDGGSFSPASHTLILSRANSRGRGNSLWLADTERKTVTRLTPDSEASQTAVVSADGNSMLIVPTNGYQSSVKQRSLTASGKEEQLIETGGFLYVEDESQDGRYASFSLQDPKTGFDVYYMDLKGDRKLVPFLNSPYGESASKFSPDHKWLAYASDENGSLELYVTPFPGGGFKWQVSAGGVKAGIFGNLTSWSADGKALRYARGDKIYSVDVRTNGDKLEFSAPKEVMTVPADVGVISILPDGKRILGTRPVGHRAAAPIVLVLNWQHLVQ